MKKIFSILLSLALVVGLSLATAAPVMAVELPSVSPTEAEYDLDNPQHIAVNMDFGDADDLDSVEDDDGTLSAGTDYYQFEGLLVIPESYLDSKLDCIGDEWIFQINFTPFGVCFLTVTAVGTPPALEDASADWDFYSSPEDDVITGIIWGAGADDVASVKEIVGGVVVDTLTETSEWAHTTGATAVLNITGSYLDSRLTSIGDDVTLTVEFNSCDYDVVLTSVAHTTTITIEAVGVTAPRLAPTSATYDLCDPGDLEFTITWDGADDITAVKDVTMIGLGYPKTIAETSNWTAADNTLTIKNSYLSVELTAAGSAKYLEVTFNDPATTKVNLLITSAWSDQPWMGVTSNIYTFDLDTLTGNLGDTGVGSLANFGCATTVTGVLDVAADKALSYGTQYLTMYITGYGYLVMVTTQGYLKYYLTELGDTITFSVGFNKGDNATFIVNAVGTQPSISPASAEFNLDAPANVTTVVDFGYPYFHATSIEDITDPDGALVENTDYLFDGQNLTILDSYLSGVLTEIDATVVLTIEFDEGDDGKLTIKAVGTPLCLIATAAGADAPQLDILREFRDKVLRPNPLGAKLVSLYYKTSPPIAELISQNEALRTAVNVFLDPIVAILNWSHGLWS